MINNTMTETQFPYGRPLPRYYTTEEAYNLAFTAYMITPAGIAEEKKEARRLQQAEAKEAMRAANRAGIEYATEAQISYLTSLLPRYYGIQAADGITMETAVWEANGAIKAAALRKLTKSEASSWISAAKEEIKAL